MFKIRKGIWETSSSSASALAMLSNGVKALPRLDKPFRCIRGLYDTECDGRPHLYLTNWMDKMAYLADDTDEWHQMFKQATGQEFELWMAVYADAAQVASIRAAGYSIEKYPKPIIASDFVQTDFNTFSRTESLYRDPEYGYICGYDIDYCLGNDAHLVRVCDYAELSALANISSISTYSADDWSPANIITTGQFSGPKDQVLLSEIIFNPGFAINIGGDAFENDTQTVPVINSAEDVPVQRRGFTNLKEYYKNGMERLLIAEDGTKIRIFDENSEPYYPESIDLKITDNCEHACPFCYESCTPAGKHGNLAECLTNLPEFVELAIGGGNALNHPKYSEFLALTAYVNTTLHAKDFVSLFKPGMLSDEEGTDIWDFWCNTLPDLPVAKCRALGVSVSCVKDAEEVAKVYAGNSTYDMCSSILGNASRYCGESFGNLEKGVDTVIHVVNGVVTEDMLKPLYDMDLKLLVLGYKTKGRGIEYADNTSLAENQKWLYDNIDEVASHFKTVAYDTLALKQLDMQRWLTKQQWDSTFMGEDGLHSMYIDLVTQTYGISSTDNRRWPLTKDIHEMFTHVRDIVKQDTLNNSECTHIFA